MPRLRDPSPRIARVPALQRMLPVAALCAVAVFLAACGKADAPAAAGGAPKMPPVEVGVVVATPGDVGLITELPGRVEASRVAQVRARAAGILLQRQFREGSDVKAGQPLFRIDPATYAAAADSAKASLAKAEANLAQATATVERYRPLVAANAISKQDFVNAEATQKQAQADVDAGRAATRTAGINLGYASVTAPISGRIGRALVTEGALVGQGEATPLAIIQQIDPVYVNFTQSTTEVLQLRKCASPAASCKKRGQRRGQACSMRAQKTAASVPAHPGKLLFSRPDRRRRPRARSRCAPKCPTRSGLLLPGMYVRVQIELAQAEQWPSGILLPQQAVTRSEQGRHGAAWSVPTTSPAPRSDQDQRSAQGNQLAGDSRACSPERRSSSTASRRCRWCPRARR